MNRSWMHSCSAHSTIPMTFVKSNRKQDVRCLRSTISNEGFIRGPLKIRILEIHRRESVTRRSQVDEASSSVDERRNPVDEHEVAQMIGAELRLKAVDRMAEWSSHHSRIGDYHIEGFALCEQFFGAGTHALKICEVESCQIEPSIVGCGILSYLRSCRFCLRQIMCSTDHVRAVCGKGARGLDSDSSGNASY